MEKLTAQERPTAKRILTYLLQALIIGLLAWYLYQNRDVLAALRNVRWQQVVWIVVLDLVMMLVITYINYLMIRRFDSRVTFIDCLMLQYVNSLLNKILPTIGGGAAFRAYFLKKKYQFPYTHFASTVVSLYVISFAATAFIANICLLAIYARNGAFNWVIFLAFTGIMLATLTIILISPRIPASQNQLLRILKNLVESWNVIKKEPRFVLGYALLSVLLLFLSAAYIYVGYAGLGVQTGPIPMLYLSTLGIIMAFLNFTPDGIGIKEGIYLFSQDLVRIPDEILVLGSLYLRGISMVSTLLFAAISYMILSRELRRTGNLPVTAANEKTG